MRFVLFTSIVYDFFEYLHYVSLVNQHYYGSVDPYFVSVDQLVLSTHFVLSCKAPQFWKLAGEYRPVFVDDQHAE